MPSIIQGMEGIWGSVSQEPPAPAAASATAGKSLDGTVSPAMLNLAEELAFPASCCPFPAGRCRGGEGGRQPQAGSWQCSGEGVIPESS